MTGLDSRGTVIVLPFSRYERVPPMLYWVGISGAAKLVGMKVHLALPIPSFWGVLGSFPVKIPVPSTAVMLLRMGSVMPNKSLTILPFSSLIWRVTARLVRLVGLPFSIS